MSKVTKYIVYFKYWMTLKYPNIDFILNKTEMGVVKYYVLNFEEKNTCKSAQLGL